MKNTDNFDVVIVGGGPAGCATALSLKKRANLSILLIEASSFEKTRIGETIPPDTRPLLDKLGLWPRFCADAHIACHGSMSIWGNATIGCNDHIVNVNGSAWHLNRRLFDDMFLSAMIRAGIEVRLGTNFQNIDTLDTDDNKILLSLKNFNGTQSVRTKFVVDASGQHAVIAKKFGAKRQNFDRMAFIMGQFKIPKKNELPNQTLLEAVKEGWWYAVELPNNKVLVACATDGEQLKEKDITKSHEWLIALTKSRLIAPYLVNAKFIADSFLTKTSFSFLMNPCFGSNWVAVGDAVTSFDPIASLGIYKGLNSGIECANAILSAFDGDSNAISQYSKARAMEFDQYEVIRNYFYTNEKRWKDAPFWKNRLKI